MRYYYEKDTHKRAVFGKAVLSDHPLYNSCTLYKIRSKGLAVIQQRFDEKAKTTSWGAIDPWIVNDIYMQEGFKEFFDKNASEINNGVYPTVTVRHLMHALKMKPLPKQSWETVFDRTRI